MSSAANPFSRKTDFLSILDLDHAELDDLISLAVRMKAERALGPKAPTVNALSGLHVALLFEKPSLRTRSTCRRTSPRACASRWRTWRGTSSAGCARW